MVYRAMYSVSRKQTSGRRPQYCGRLVSFGATLVGLSLALAGCSADMSRFNSPLLGYGAGASDVPPEPAEPVYGSSSGGYSPNGQAGSRQQGYAQSGQGAGYGAGYDSQSTPGYGMSRYQAASPYGNQTAGSANGAYGANANDRVASLQPDAGPSGPSAYGSPYGSRYSGGGTSFGGNGSGGTGETSPSANRWDGQPGSRVVTIKPGDTLYGLSKDYGVSISALKRANGLSNQPIRVGQKFVIPGIGEDTSGTTSGAEPRVRVADAAPESDSATDAGSRYASSDGGDYVVQSGDSLYAIARKLGVSQRELRQENGISDPSKLRVGQRLRLPGGSGYDSGASTADGDARLPEREVAMLPPDTDERDIGTRSDNAGADETAGGTETRFRWPVDGRIIGKFGPGADGVHNDGIDIAVPLGTSVRAAEDGVVAYAGSELKGYGNLVLIRHADDWVSAYAHNERLLVSRGDKVERGQEIAKAGRSGSVSRPQLHFELRKGSTPVDPMKHMASR